MTQWLLEEALAIRLESEQLVAQLHEQQRRELAALAEDTRAAAIAALETR